MKVRLLIILSLILFSCDSGGDGDGGNNLSTSDLNGEWWGVEYCGSTSACDGYPADQECYDGDGEYYIYVVDGTQFDCSTADMPECDLDNPTVTFTIGSGNTMEVCQVDPNCSLYGSDDCDNQDNCDWD